MYQPPNFCRRQAITFADHLVLALHDQVINVAIRNSAQYRRVVPVLHFQTHRLHQIAFAVSAFAVAHRAVISKNLFCGSQHFRRGFHGIFFLYWRCRRRCSRRGHRRFRRFLLGFFLYAANANTNGDSDAQHLQNIAHERLPRKSLARLFQAHLSLNHDVRDLCDAVYTHEARIAQKTFLDDSIIATPAPNCLFLSGRLLECGSVPTAGGPSCRFFESGVLLPHSKSRQFGPVQISTASGTSSLYTPSISSRTNFSSAFCSLGGASNSNSSCTCKIICARNFSFFNRFAMAIIASLIKSAAVPCSGEFSAVRSAKFRNCT